MNKSMTNLPGFDPNLQIKLEDFKVLPRFVGTWEGNWIRLDKDGNEIERFTSILNQNIVNNQWVQTNQNKYLDGKIVNISFFGKAVGVGKVLFESPDYPYCNFQMIVEEYSDNIIMIRVSDKITGFPLALETINLISDTERIRTLQKFKLPDGKLSGFIIVVENKILRNSGRDYQ
ncbi:MAG: hypothetical protein RM022_032735 [Nostoc sp. EfeVER01]|uniref:hypothetical protein n=1 Tax=unclassified Nostoc TaxID=2593658 RepID=UPI002AD33671|nr:MULTISPECIES: hypothetical protein [unclassified Nostoc]MDZ7944012.1 hypothetical protein [Nostoc sp. EfeVER01]MDZ7993981.1 hypothetical protein [Nostoc sp. EspVER01]